MTTCPTCATPAAPGARFCGTCGTGLPQACAVCGAPAAPGQGFCTSCGSRIGAIRRRGEERRRVSVLFVDVVGWTSLAEQVDPEDLRAAQQEYFSVVRSTVEEHGGTVEKYLGDAVLACWGAPRATDDDALRAVRAALAARDELATRSFGPAFAALAGTGGGPDAPALQVRAGIATGEALVDLDADPARGQSFVTGDVVNLAARLQTAAVPGRVLVGPETYAATADRVTYEPAGDLALKGKAERVPGWYATGLRADLRASRRHATPLVGRTAQLRLLESCLSRVVTDGSGALVTVTGEPGIGKTRLLLELQARTGDDVRWLAGSCSAAGPQGGLAPLADVVCAWVGLGELAGPERVRERLHAAVSALLPGRPGEELAEALGPLLGLPGSEQRPGGALLDSLAGDFSRTAVAGWRRLVVTLAEERPTVLVLEDLHRAGDDLLDAVEALLPLAAEVPLLLVVTSWPELADRRPHWGGSGQDVVTLSLPPLDEDESRQLFGDLLGDVTVPDAVVDRLVAVAGGNPLYAEECAAALRERLSGEVPREVAELPLPRSVRGIVASRLDLLDDDEICALQAAAVLGDASWPSAVAQVGELAPGPTDAVLGGLVRRGLLRRVRPSRLPDEPEYAFRSSLVRALVHRRLPRTRRLELYVRAGAWWEARPDTSRAAERVEALAHCRVAALDLARSLGDPSVPLRVEQARLALLAAARLAYDLRAYGTARAHLDRALDLWPLDLDPADRTACRQLADELALVTTPGSGAATAEHPARAADTATELRRLSLADDARRGLDLLERAARPPERR